MTLARILKRKRSLVVVGIGTKNCRVYTTKAKKESGGCNGGFDVVAFRFFDLRFPLWRRLLPSSSSPLSSRVKMSETTRLFLEVLEEGKRKRLGGVSLQQDRSERTCIGYGSELKM